MLLFAKCWRWSIDHVKVRPDLFDAKSRYSIKDNGNLHLWVFNLNFNQIPFSVTNFNLIGDKENQINWSFNWLISIFFLFQAKNKTSVPNKPKGEKSNFRVIWGKVTRTHGNAGSVRAKFARNLPPQAMGKRVRVMMYPSKI